MIRRSPRTSSKVLLLIAATLWIARVVELSRALSLRIIFPCWWTQVCRRPSASLDDSQRRLAERAGCILLPIHTHAIAWLLAWLGLGHAPHRNFEAENQASVSPSILPQLFRFSFFGGGHPTTRNLLCSPLPARNFGRWRSSRARVGRGESVYSFFRSRSRRGPFKRTNRGAKKTATEASGTEAP